jgi:hypothetical protein
VLLARVRPLSARPAEEIIAESTAFCRASGRLTWVVLDWLVHHIDAIDIRALLRHTFRQGDSSVLGLLADAANLHRPNPKFVDIIKNCGPAPEVTPFFFRVAKSPLATQLAQENSIEIFRRWNYLCSELRFLDNEVGTADPNN